MKQNAKRTPNTANANTINTEGLPAYSYDEKTKLVTEVLTTFFNEPKYYGDNSNTIVEDATSLAKTDPHFVANLARYARKEYHMRTIAHVLSAIVAHEVESKPFIKEVVDDVVERADDITEIISTYKNFYDTPKSLPNGLKKAIAKAFDRFNEFQLSKYARATSKRSVSLADAIKLTHPKRSDLFKKVIEDKLEPADRWERAISMGGNNSTTWERLIDDGAIGYMAMLRNLRNILKSGVSEKHMQKVADMLSDENAVLKSKQLPFRYYSAYKQLSNDGFVNTLIMHSLETALNHSIKNMEHLSGKTAIAIDVSGSMSSRISNKSIISCGEVALLLGKLIEHISDDSIVMLFSDSLHLMPQHKNVSILDAVTKMSSGIGGGTNMTLPYKYLLENDIAVDRMIVLSDNEHNNLRNGFIGFFTDRSTETEKSRRNYGKKYPNTWLHCVDLLGYGTTQFEGNKTNYITGWSEKLLSFISMVEQGLDNQVKIIESYPYTKKELVA